MVLPSCGCSAIRTHRRTRNTLLVSKCVRVLLHLLRNIAPPLEDKEDHKQARLTCRRVYLDIYKITTRILDSYCSTRLHRYYGSLSMALGSYWRRGGRNSIHCSQDCAHSTARRPSSHRI